MVCMLTSHVVFCSLPTFRVRYSIVSGVTRPRSCGKSVKHFIHSTPWIVANLKNEWVFFAWLLDNEHRFSLTRTEAISGCKPVTVVHAAILSHGLSKNRLGHLRQRMGFKPECSGSELSGNLGDDD
jgi:hypothetical protein